ncbi:MAG: transcription antitermination factor NusB [Cyclobacteriaceae bacterium]
MVNRRTLRIKAVKALYAYSSCKQANYQVAREQLNEKFSVNSNWLADFSAQELETKKAAAAQCLDKHFEGEAIEKQADLLPEIKAEALNAVRSYKEQNAKDLKRQRHAMLEELESTEDSHLRVLDLIIELANINKSLFDEKKSLSDILGAEMNDIPYFYENKVIRKLAACKEITERKLRKGISWSTEEDKLVDWYKKIIFKYEPFVAYRSTTSHTYDEDWIILDDIVRNVIFKNDSINGFFEELDYNWEENKTIIRSLVLKTLKSVKNSSDELTVAEFSYNWEEDRAYLEILFDKSIEEDTYFEGLIEKKSLNWNIERIAQIDIIVIKSAIAEMIHFPSIPVKVTINEFIEITKVYSTPKSKKFVNGLLDVIASELQKEGVVKKSGRGLIDNK